MPVFLTFLNTI